ncbi:MAG: hypothetical protein KAV82_00825 [Phycisphaerae bacterium]|nr:hypothetical protein [Phycisphaerae bacterium]
MNMLRRIAIVGVLGVALLASGCATAKVDFTSIKCPPRAAELDAYSVFVGDWNWKAELVNAEDADKQWTGTASWKWILDNRCLHGEMSAKSANAGFNAAGIWSWHPKAKKYIWWMFNNWGYPQQGTAKYNEQEKCWKMPFTSVGLDGTTSYGLYTLNVVGKNSIDWTLQEWADAMHMVLKMEMKGTYTRK